MRVYTTSTSDFSWRMNAEELIANDWAMAKRGLFSYDKIADRWALFQNDELMVLVAASRSGECDILADQEIYLLVKSRFQGRRIDLFFQRRAGYGLD